MSECKKIKLETIEYARCSAAFCDNVYSRTMHNKPHIVYYPFPYDKMISGQWKQFCRQNNSGHSFNFLCSEHFCPDDYIIDEFGFKKLKFDAVPSVLPQNKDLKSEEIEIGIVHTIEHGNSEYDEYHVYELDDCTSDPLDQTNASTTSERSNTEEPSNLQNIEDGADDDDAAEDLDETTIELLEDNSGIGGSDTPDCFESETIRDPRMKSKMLYEEARTALKLTASIKPPLPPKSTMEDAFGKRVAEQLKRISDEKIYNDTVWSVQKALHDGIDKVKKNKTTSCEVIDDIIVLDSPPEQNGDHENEDTQLESITVQSDVSDDKSESGKTQTNEDKSAESAKPIETPASTENNPQLTSASSTPLQPQIRIPPLFSIEGNSQPQTSSPVAFSNSAVQDSARIIVSSIEDRTQNIQPTSSTTNYSEKLASFQKVILEPREPRPIISSVCSIPEILPRLQSNPNGTQATCSTSNTQNNPQKTDTPPPTTVGTQLPNITVPIILICPPAVNQTSNGSNSSISNCNIPSSISNDRLNPNILPQTNLPGFPSQTTTGSTLGVSANQPVAAVDILRAVSNLLAASVATPRP